MNSPTLPLASVLGHDQTDKRIDILRRIGELGSISEAARKAGVSYKAAWQAVETLTNLAGQPLVDKAVGGSGGGGAVLTPAGTQVLRAADAMTQARQGVLADLAQRDPGTRRAALALRTSMRNQFPCTVTDVRLLQGQALLTLGIGADQQVHARVTRVSAQLMGLRKGMEVLGLCKATAVQVLPAGAEPPKANSLHGKVHRTSRGECTVVLEGGVQLVGFARAGFVPRRGHSVVAVVDEASIVIGAMS